MAIEWEIIENPEPNPWADAALDALEEASRLADHWEIWIGY